MSVSPEIVSQWEAYLAEEKAGVRSEALLQLDAFIASLRSQRESDWQGWAVGLSEEVVDLQRDIPVRMPLFRSVIFPALHSRLAAGSGSAARMLAGFSQLLYHSPECRDQLPPQLQSEHGLILEAVRRDASDLRAKRRLRAILRGRFEYSLHELPSGVLYGHDGATVEQCSELADELAKYASLCAEIGSEDVDREIIDDASFFIPAYRDYLTRQETYDSFADYIEAHKKGRGEQGAPPNSRPPQELPASTEDQTPDSLRTPFPGGCG
jgi:hypothetical protein